VPYALGVDAYKGGWVALALGNGSVEGCQLYGRISELIGDHPEAGVIAVDIPIGLPEKGPAFDPQLSHLRGQLLMRSVS
jgi:predicted RNase H-like nuclease